MPGPQTGPYGHIRASKGSRVLANNRQMAQSQWRGTWRGEDVDTSNFEALGFEQGTIGFQVFEYSTQGFWNAQQNPLDLPGIFPTDLFPNTTFFTNTGDNVFWFLPFARILSCENDTGNLKSGAIGFNWQGRSNAGFTVPTGSF